MVEESRSLTFATILIAAIAGLAGFAVFLFAGGMIASFLAGRLHIPVMEGARGYFAITIGMMAGLVGFIGAIWFALRRRGVRGGRILLGGATAFAIIILSAASAVGIWYTMQPHALNLHGPEPILRLEVRSPENLSPELFGSLAGEMNTDRNGADVVLDKASETERLIRRGYVPLYYRTSHRLLALKFAEGGARLFNLRLPANPMPKKYHVWSEWQKPDFVDEPGSTGPKKAGDGSDFEIRYRVETAED